MTNTKKLSAGASLQAHDILESISDAFFALDHDWCFTYINDPSERVMARKREDLLGRCFWDEFPAAVGSLFEREYRRAVEERVTVTFEEYYPPLSIWVEVRAYPSSDGLSVFYQDISARKKAEEALRRSQQDLLLAVDAAQLGTFYCDWPLDKMVWNDICKAHFFLPANAEVDFALFYALLHPDDREPTRQAIDQAFAERVQYNVEYRSLAPDGRTRWINAVGRFYYDEAGSPVRFDGITRDISERKAAEEERMRLANANSLLLNSTGDGIYGIDLNGCFTFINQSAAQMLGFTPQQTIGQSAHALVHHTRPNGSPYPESACPIHHVLRNEKGVHVEDDVFWRTDGTSFPVSYNAAPIVEQDAVQGAVVTFFDTTGRRALDAERERLALHEHNIAQQLQQALQPELPGTVPGMAVTKYYKAALAEAGVGGDFYDVFSVEKGRTALVVGDLSGKGLAAAAQVSTVRNMLRAFLYTQPSVSEAVTELNRVLAENNLLTGFATLWAGCYDAATGELSYVNCGQEPALVRRAVTGSVERLMPTGPVLGAAENVFYAKSAVTLLPGDALAVFTDGATECGLSRRQMLGIDGVVSLMGLPFTPEETGSAARRAETLAGRLVEGVDAVSQGGLAKDDICILVAVAEDGFSGLRLMPEGAEGDRAGNGELCAL